MSPNHPTTIFGAFALSIIEADAVNEILDLLRKFNVKELDTARIYPGSEESIGKLKIASEFLIDTKARSFTPGTLNKEGIITSFKESFELLGVDSVETYFLHAPDPETPIAETLEAVDVFYKQGKFKKFGLSNYSPSEVREIYDISVSKGYAIPTVYQGNYNAVARHIEKDLFPVLRELKISFYAYSPIAGGFLAHTPVEIEEGSTFRFEKTSFIGQMYQSLYNRPALLKALKVWNGIAEKAGISNADLAYRWIFYHSALDKSYGDAVIIGGRTPEQVRQTLEAIEDGPLSSKIVAQIEDVWEIAEADAPVNNYLK